MGPILRELFIHIMFIEESETLNEKVRENKKLFVFNNKITSS